MLLLLCILYWSIYWHTLHGIEVLATTVYRSTDQQGEGKLTDFLFRSSQIKDISQSLSSRSVYVVYRTTSPATMSAVMKHQKMCHLKMSPELVRQLLQIDVIGTFKPGISPEQTHMYVLYVEVTFKSYRPTVSNTSCSSRRQCWFRSLIDSMEHWAKQLVRTNLLQVVQEASLLNGVDGKIKRRR